MTYSRYNFTGLKVLMVCFEDRLALEWYRIYQAMETVVDSQIGEESLSGMCLGVNAKSNQLWLLLQHYC